MKYRLADLAKIVGGSVRGDADLEIESIQGLDLAGPADIAFLNHPRYRREALGSSAGAIVIDRDDDVFTQSLLVCDNPSLAVAKIVRLFFPSQVPESGIHPTAVVAADATVDPGATVGPYVTIGHRSTVGTGAVLRSHIAVGDDCHISAEVVLNPHVVLYDGTRIGERTIVHSGTILGADGFRYVYHDGVHEKVPQVGTVILEEDIEIGANSAVDRAALEVTRVGAGTKIDNHVQVAHNVQIGKACILCGGAALAGSARLGDGVVIGGHGAVNNHVTIGDGVQIAGQAAVFKDQPDGAAVAGTPARDARQWRRENALLGRLGDMRSRLRALEKRIAELET